MIPSRDTIRLIITTLAPHKKLLACIAVVMIISSVLETFGITMIIPLMNSLVGEGGGEYRQYFEPVQDVLGLEYMPIAIALILLGSMVLQMLFRVWGVYMETKLTNRLRIEWALKTFHKYLFSEYNFVLSHKLGKVVHNLQTETVVATKLFITLFKLVYEATVFLFVYAVLLYHYTTPTIALSLIYFIFFIVLNHYGAGIIQSITAKSIKYSQSLGSMATETLSAVNHIKALVMENSLFARFKDLQVRRADAMLIRTLYTEFLNNVINPIQGLFLLLLLIYFIVIQELALSQIVAILGFFIAATYKMNSSLQGISRHHLSIYKALPSLNVIQGIINAPSVVEELDKGEPFEGLKTDIRFEDVHFRYPDGSVVFEGFSISFPYKRMTALVGPSGVGKSTVVNLLLRLYQPTAGTIRVNDAPLDDFSLATWRRGVGYVSQEPFLFNMTIRENILAAKPDATEDELVEAARAANALAFIESLPDGWGAVVGDRGLKLSGGQRQRIAIARAIIRKPSLYIFDEATSALDRESEKYIQDSIERLSQEATMIVIAHRLKTIENAEVVHDLATLPGVRRG